MYNLNIYTVQLTVCEFFLFSAPRLYNNINCSPNTKYKELMFVLDFKLNNHEINVHCNS